MLLAKFQDKQWTRNAAINLFHAPYQASSPRSLFSKDTLSVQVKWKILGCAHV